VTLRVVDQRTAVMPIDEATAAEPDKVLDAMRRLLRPARAGSKAAAKQR
jgi:hypothetical protein